jgi:hypothetical protein
VYLLIFIFSLMINLDTEFKRMVIVKFFVQLRVKRWLGQCYYISKIFYALCGVHHITNV